jgi:hypothetical protein
MPEEVKDRVHTLARRSKSARGLTFGWRDGTEIDPEEDNGYDSDADSDYDPAADDNVSTAGVDKDEDENEDYIGDNDNEAGPDLEDNVEDPPEDDGEPPPLGPPPVNYDSDDEDDDESDDDVAPVPRPEPEPEDDAGVDDTRMPGLRPQQRRNYDETTRRTRNVQAPQNFMNAQNGMECLEHTALTQYSIRKGLKVFGEAGKLAVLKEMQQLHDRTVIEPKMASMLTKDEKKKSLEYLMFLKKKRCGKIKGRGCADGRKQRIYKTKEETSSPTVRTESLFLSCVIDAKEGRDVATTDIPGAFMQADMDELVHMRLVGPLVKLLTKVDPELYEKYIEYEKGTPVMYVKLSKALYGTLQASLLFWKDLTSNLLKWGFKLNPYDECVANKDIDGKQCTILWHVDDLKISHVDAKVVDGILDLLGERYGKEEPLTTTRGKVHDYLGMQIDFSVEGKVIIRMDEYIQEILDEARSDMDGLATSPAANHLFMINANPVVLCEEDKQYFHTMTAKILWVAKRAKPDLQQAIAFLTTRVQSPDQDDYKKLARVVRFLRATADDPLTLEADATHVVKWWVDASYGVHPDMKSHTGGTMTMGKGSVYSTSVRQRLNTKSSTEAELVGVDDVMPQVLWTKYFLEAQGYRVDGTDVFQDNQSCILLAKNGRASSGKRTRHINIRYFFVADRVKAGEIDIKYCPTGEMVADYFTKPLQGKKFTEFRNAILNIQK